MGSKPVKSGEGVTEVRYNSQNAGRTDSGLGDGDSYGMRGTPQSTPPPGDSLSAGAKDKRQGFTYSSPEKHRRDNPRETKMMNDQGEAIDKGFSFRREKVHRVPTRAVLKPPKDKNSLIAQPDEDEEEEEESRGASPGVMSGSGRSDNDSTSMPPSETY